MSIETFWAWRDVLGVAVMCLGYLVLVAEIHSPLKRRIALAGLVLLACASLAFAEDALIYQRPPCENDPFWFLRWECWF
jgi:hypothetical protein